MGVPHDFYVIFFILYLSVFFYYSNVNFSWFLRTSGSHTYQKPQTDKELTLRLDILYATKVSFSLNVLDTIRTWNLILFKDKIQVLFF